MHYSAEAAIKKRIIEHGPGWCFTPFHFSDLESDASIRKALSQLEKQKFIRRLARGVYEYPKKHDTLGLIPPDLNKVAKAIAEKDGGSIQPSGAHAANIVGLSTQVPGRIVFLTEAAPRKIKIGNQEIIFKKTTKKNMFSAGTKEGLVIQALKYLGKDHIDQKVCMQVYKFLKNSPKDVIKKNMKFAPAWIRRLVFEIMEVKPKP
jgi:hypothetical protein